MNTESQKGKMFIIDENGEQIELGTATGIDLNTDGIKYMGNSEDFGISGSIDFKIKNGKKQFRKLLKFLHKDCEHEILKERTRKILGVKFKKTTCFYCGKRMKK